jgi:hypothetical protein
MRTKNDEWIDLSLRSIKDFADEVIIADTSTDDTPKIIQKVATEENIKLKLITMKENQKTAMSSLETYVKQSNIALKNTNYRWVFRWEADFVARTSGPFNILNLRKQILNLDDKKYYWIEIPIINLDGDIFHIAQDPVTVEAYACTFSPDLQFKKESKMEILKAPKYYKVMRIKEFYIFHLRTVKSAKYLLFRRFWDDWKELADFERFPNLQTYVEYRILKDWGIKDINNALKFNLVEFFSKQRPLSPYDQKRFGEYPDLLKEQIKNPRYKLIYKNGQLIGRNDILT